MRVRQVERVGPSGEVGRAGWSVLPRLVRMAALLLTFLAILAGLGLPKFAAAAEPPVTAVAIAPGGASVVLGSQLGLEIRQWPELRLEKTWTTELAHVHDLAFSPDGRRLLVAGGAPAEAGTVELRSWPGGDVLQNFAVADDLVMRVAWTPDGSGWVAASADGMCRCFTKEQTLPTEVFGGHSSGLLAICFLADGHSILSGGLDHTLQLWDFRSGAGVRSLSNHSGAVNDVAVKPGSNDPLPSTATDPKAPPSILPIAASASDDHTVRLWQPTIGRLLRFVKLPSIPRAIAWSHDGRRLIAGCDDGRLRILDGESLQLIETVEAGDAPVLAIAMHGRNDHFLAAGSLQPRVFRLSQRPVSRQ